MGDMKAPLIIQTPSSQGRQLVYHVHGDNNLGHSPKPVTHSERTGSLWTASGHIITAVIGSGVLSLAWCMAQLGWLAGTTTILVFSILTYYASTLLVDCYRCHDNIHGKRNATYTQAVKRILGDKQAWICGLIQYMIMYRAGIGHTITAALSIQSISKQFFVDVNGNHNVPSNWNSICIIMFGVTQLLLSQIPNFDRVWWLSIVASIMSFSYSTIGLSLSILEVVETGEIKGTLWGVSKQELGGSTQKMWHVFRALGDIAFAFSYSAVLIEIQDTLKSPPAENVTMKKAALCGGSITTFFYILCACFGYAAFGDNSPGNLLTSSQLHGPWWLIHFANICIFVHLLGAYQVFSQPLFATFERWASEKYDGMFSMDYGSWYMRFAWRCAYVLSTTATAIMFPFFNDVLGLIGSINFWPLTIYFPVEMYIVNVNVRRWTKRWVVLKTLSSACLLVSLVAISGAVEGFVEGFSSRGQVGA